MKHSRGHPFPRTHSPHETTQGHFNKYVGLPFKAHGREGSGLDCYGLVRLVYREEYGIELPDYLDRYDKSLDRREVSFLFQFATAGTTWTKIDKPEAGAVLLLRLFGRPFHCAVMLDADRFLHVADGITSSIERLRSPLWRKRIIGFYKHASC